jgi:hypothetical protein
MIHIVLIDGVIKGAWSEYPAALEFFKQAVKENPQSMVIIEGWVKDRLETAYSSKAYFKDEKNVGI